MSVWDDFWKDHKVSKAEAWISSQRDLVLERSLDRLGPGPKKVLEVGCGTANNLRHIKNGRPDAECWALDNSPVAVEKARRDFPNAVVGDCAATPFADGQFDLVFSAGVLEHLPDEAAFAREMRRILRGGGLLVTFVPARYSLWRLYQLFLWRFRGHEYERSYTRGELERLFSGAGFEEVEYLGLDPFSLQGAVMKALNISFDPPVKRTPFESAYTEICLVAGKNE